MNSRFNFNALLSLNMKHRDLNQHIIHYKAALLSHDRAVNLPIKLGVSDFKGTVKTELKRSAYLIPMVGGKVCLSTAKPMNSESCRNPREPSGISLFNTMLRSPV